MFNKNEVIYSGGIGVCKVSDIVNLQVNKRPPIQYYLLSSVFDKKKTSYIPVSGHQVALRHLITVDEAKEKVRQKNISEIEKSEIEYVIGNNGTIYEEKAQSCVWVIRMQWEMESATPSLPGQRCMRSRKWEYALQSKEYMVS